jgi:ABC-type sugar transport system ATPase subunit
MSQTSSRSDVSDNPAGSLLSVRHAHKSYDGLPALVDVSLDLDAGDVHALMGENGAGKSTLIKLLAGVLNADSLHLSVRGVPVRGAYTAQAAFALGLRFIHQELSIVPQLSVAENLFLSQRYPTRGGVFVNWRALHGAARDVLAQLGVTHLDPRTPLARLSPGEQMLVKIAGAFVGGDGAQGAATVYVMDEPTAALTGAEAEQLFRVIGRLRERGCAILYVSHRIDEIFRIATRVTVLRDGRVVASGPIAATTPADLIHHMTGREFQHVYPPREAAIGGAVLLAVRDLRSAAIAGVSFEVRRGEIVGVAGLAGSGRTELLRALMGADRVLGGEVRVDGAPLTHRTPTGAWQGGVAFVPEERRSQALVLSRSVSNNVTLPHLRHFRRLGTFLHHAGEQRTAAAVGHAVRLKARDPRQRVRLLSGGNQQKVVFARALARAPRLLLLDEPTRGIDVGAKYDLYALIRQISATGAGILMVSSELPELIGLCDRLLIMRRGRLMQSVGTAGLSEGRLLQLCYGDEMHAHGERPHDR